MVTIRLSRVGRNKQPSYRIIVSEKKRDLYGHSIEIVGHYHPRSKEKKDELILNTERIQYWLGKGATTSNTLNNLFIDAGLIKGEKKRTVYGKAKTPTTVPTIEGVGIPTDNVGKKAPAPKEQTPATETTASSTETAAG